MVLLLQNAIMLQTYSTEACLMSNLALICDAVLILTDMLTAVITLQPSLPPEPHC